MAQLSNVHGGRQPTNRIAANTYNPHVGGTSGHPVDYPIGTPVAQSTSVSGTVIPARADAATTASVTGLAAGRAVVGSDAIVQMDGVLNLTAPQWDAITGGSGGLTHGAVYFLDDADEGKMTTTAPSADGEFVTPLGIALSAEDFLIQIGAAEVVVAGPSPAGLGGAMFFGTTSGTGSAGNDYAATVAVGSSVPFPRDGAASGDLFTRISTTQVRVDVAGIYEISWAVAFSEPSQLQVSVGGFGVASTCTLSGAGTQINSNTVLLQLEDGDIVSLLNPPGNATALTVQPADGSLTHAQAPSLTFRRMA